MIILFLYVKCPLGADPINLIRHATPLWSLKGSDIKTVQYHYNLNGEVIAEGDSTGNIKVNYVWGPDRTLVKKDMTTGKDYYYLYNGHGDVIQVVDTFGNVVK